MVSDFITLKNGSGVVVTLSNFGARIVGIIVPDKDQNSVDVVLGFNSIDEYIQTPDPYYGATIGRYANRIAKGSLLIEGKHYSLPVNNGENHLHGGPHGFHTKFWSVDQVSETSVTFSILSKDDEEGYPGNLQVTVTYTLTDGCELRIQFNAITDATTVVNLTNHAFFNLNGEGSGLIEDHVITIEANYFTPVNSSLIPTGEIRSVINTPFDFTTAQTIGSRIHSNEEQLKLGNGYDHNFVLRSQNATGLVLAASAVGDKTGIKLEVFTTEPGMQLYTGNFMLGRNKLKHGSMDEFRTAFCFETQHYPDSPNQPSFPSTVLKKGEEFRSETVFKFSDYSRKAAETQ
jgi:aldose 1-epimerase